MSESVSEPLSEVLTLSESVSESVSEVSENLVSVSESVSEVSKNFVSESESASDTDSDTSSCPNSCPCPPNSAVRFFKFISFCVFFNSYRNTLIISLEEFEFSFYMEIVIEKIPPPNDLPQFSKICTQKKVHLV